MKYCHSCRYEFRDEIEVCPDCGVELQTTPPAPEKYREVEWVQLRFLESPLYAEMVKEVLDNEGIPNYLSFDFIAASFSIRGASLVGESGKLFVPKEFAKQAQDIVDPLINDDDEETEDD